MRGPRGWRPRWGGRAQCGRGPRLPRVTARHREARRTGCELRSKRSLRTCNEQLSVSSWFWRMPPAPGHKRPPWCWILQPSSGLPGRPSSSTSEPRRSTGKSPATVLRGLRLECRHVCWRHHRQRSGGEGISALESQPERARGSRPGNHAVIVADLWWGVELVHGNEPGCGGSHLPNHAAVLRREPDPFQRGLRAYADGDLQSGNSLRAAARRHGRRRRKRPASPMRRRRSCRAACAWRQNVPNPFNPSTRIAFSLPEAGTVRLQVRGADGRLVSRLVDTRIADGEHAAVWDGPRRVGTASTIGCVLLRADDGTGCVVAADAAAQVRATAVAMGVATTRYAWRCNGHASKSKTTGQSMKER